MATETDIVEYHKGERVVILFYSKDRTGSATPDAATHSVAMTIGDTPAGENVNSFTIASGDITLVDAPTALYRIDLDPTDLVGLVEGRTYYYNIWNWSNSTPTLKNLQAKGRFVLQNSIEVS